MPYLYIIAGCNGAGKTTASYTLLQEILDCPEFVNANIMAAEIAPHNPRGAALEAGRRTLARIHQLIAAATDFAVETTLASRSYVALIHQAKAAGYEVILLYFWLASPAFAQRRVAKRVAEGGLHIPPEVIERRYEKGMNNLIQLYMQTCDHCIVIDNTDTAPREVSWYNQYHIMDHKEIEMMQLSGKVMEGMKRTMRRLVESHAVQDKKLVTRDADGHPIEVPAKDLLKTLL